MKKLLVLAVLFVAVMAAVPHTVAASVLELPHTAEEVLLRRQSAEKLQEGCGEIPPEYAETAELIEAARRFGKERMQIWPNDMYRCYANDTSRLGYNASWLRETEIAGNRDGLGWFFADRTETPEGVVYTNATMRNLGEWNVQRVPDITAEELQKGISSLEERGFSWYARYSSVWTTYKALRPDLLALSKDHVVEAVLHEGCHDMVEQLGLSDIRNHAGISEAYCSAVGYLGGITFLAERGEEEALQTLQARFAWAMARAGVFNTIYWRLVTAFGPLASDEERAMRRDEVFAALTEEELDFFSGIYPNTAMVSYMHTYTELLPAMVGLLRHIYGL